MPTVTGLTAERMLEIEGMSVVDGEIIGGNLILTKHDGTTINAGPVAGPPGPTGPMGPSGGIPGEVRLWPGSALPALATYGKWVWADGAVYPVSTTPLAAANIAAQWRTFGGASDPGGANFRVPDLRGLAPVGMDAMPGGARANRMTRAVAITIAARTGEETHLVTVAEMPSHGHGVNDPTHAHGPAAGVGFWTIHNPGDPAAPSNLAGSGGNLYSSQPTTDYRATGISIQANGGGGAHENVQPSVFVPYIVCLSG